jgi:hypothetical protein
MKRFLFAIALLLAPAFLDAKKVLVITHNYNRPDFVEIQYKTFEKFLLDIEYEYVVFNDAPQEPMKTQIDNVCKKYGIRCIRVPQKMHTTGDRPLNKRHVNGVRYSLEVIGYDNDGPVVIIDSDMFLIRPLSIEERLGDNHILSAMRGGGPDSIDWLWPGISILAMNKLPNKRTLNYDCGPVNGHILDSGGSSYLYLKRHPGLKLEVINSLWCYQLFLADKHNQIPEKTSVAAQERIVAYKNYGFNEKEIKFLLNKPDTFEFYLDNHFLHYREGTNYTNQQQGYVDHKTRIFKEFIDNVLAD